MVGVLQHQRGKEGEKRKVIMRKKDDYFESRYVIGKI